MSNVASFKLDVSDLQEQLRQLRRDVAEAGGEVDAIVHETTEAAAAGLQHEYTQHRVTGTLATSVRKRYPRPGVGIVTSSAPHAHLFEDGTKARSNKRGANRGRMPKHRSIARVAVQFRPQMIRKLVELLKRYGFEVDA